MDLSIALNTALNALNVNQQQLAVLSQNIANANTPGYSREVANQEAISVAGTPEGVQISDVTRKVDELLTQAVQAQTSNVGQTGVIDSYNGQMQVALGNPGDQNSIDSYVNDFFDAIQSLAQTPQSATLQQGAVNSGVTLATQIQSLATQLQNMQYQADQDVNSSIKSANTDLQTLGNLNNAITTGLAVGQNVSTLQDQRDTTLADLSQYIDIKTFNQPNGAISITTGSGTSLLDTHVYQLSYNGVGSASVFSGNQPLQPVQVTRLDDTGNPTGTPVNLTTSGLPSQITSLIGGGQIAGLITLRDQTIPNIISQLNTLAATVRDQVNTVSNSGSSFPGANSLTGTRSVSAVGNNLWGGQVQIAVLGPDGQPATSPYGDETYGVQPLTLNLAAMNTGNGVGNPSVQGIIDAINQYYGAPQNKAEVGNINNVQLVSDTKALPASANQFNFDFNLNNISASNSNFFVTNVQVTDSTGADITSVTSTAPSVALDPGSTYTTVPGSSNVIIHTAAANTLTDGETVYLSTPPGGPYDGIPASDLGGYFTISSVNSSGFQITTAGTAVSGGIFGALGQTATPPYAQSVAGQTVRTNSNGLFTADLSGNPVSPYYNVTVSVGVDDGNGHITQSQINYVVNNSQPNIMNQQFGAQSVTGGGTLVAPNSTQPIAVASLVDANGNPIPTTNGVYGPLAQGYLQIKAGNSTNLIAINSLNSTEQGQPTGNPPNTGTGWGFSHYFDLNDFFQSNNPTVTGDTTANSALNMQVSQRLQNTPGLISLGQLSLGNPPSDPSALPNYTYSLNAGDNSIIQQMAALANASLNFASTGGLGASVQTLSSYAGEIIGTASTNAGTASTNSTNAQTLLTGFQQQATSISGVNLDTELANTVIYQNAYAASARIITVTSTLFDTLLQSTTG